MKKLMIAILVILGIAIIGGYFYYTSLADTPTCIIATSENGRYDVNSDGIVNFQDSGLIHINSIEIMGVDYIYNELYDMNCDEVVDSVDTDLCWENRD